MGAGEREWGENPDLLVIDEEMRSTPPALCVSVVCLEATNVIDGETVRPVAERRDLRVVQYDERRTPCRPLQCVAIAIEGVGHERSFDDPFPSSHESSPMMPQWSDVRRRTVPCGDVADNVSLVYAPRQRTGEEIR